MERYKTILKEAECEQIIEKSRFIGHAKPVKSKEEADLFFAEIRARHKSATHNVPAFVIGDKFQNQWASDDGEPQGTSGAPVVQMLVKEGITNAAVIITRYFGGIKLGTGGLVRAYTGTAKMALEAAKVCRVREQLRLKVKIDYTYHGKLQSLSSGNDFSILNTEFTDKIIVDLAAEPECEKTLRSILADVTSGNFQVIYQSQELVKSAVQENIPRDL